MNIPKQPFILASSHVSFIDPFLLSAIPGKYFKKVAGIRFIMASTYYDRWLLRALTKPLGAIRAKPMPWSFKNFFEEASLLIETGNSILIYPEGGRNNDNTRTVKPGVGYLASASNCAVVPLRITRQSLFSYSARFGRSFMVEGSDYQVISEKIYRKIMEL